MKIVNKIIMLLLVVLTFSCEDVFEDDITDDIVQIISPIEGSNVTSTSVNFQWAYLKGATKYRVQVFKSDQSIALDSLVNKNNLIFQLPSGKYRWKVRGENFGYQSSFSESVRFSTEISSILTGQKVILTIPEDDAFIKPTTLSLNWNEIPVATGYDVKVTSQSGTVLLESNDLKSGTTSVSLNILPTTPEEKYLWTVIAKNSNNSTQTDVSKRSFSIDSTPPNPPTGIKDITKTINGKITIQFDWVNSTDSGAIQSPVSYIMQYANDINFDANSRVVSSPLLATGINKFSVEFSNVGDYFWRVKAIDKAMNESYSSISKLTITN
jgi:hypothetical protein